MRLIERYNVYCPTDDPWLVPVCVRVYLVGVYLPGQPGPLPSLPEYEGYQNMIEASRPQLPLSLSLCSLSAEVIAPGTKDDV